MSRWPGVRLAARRALFLGCPEGCPRCGRCVEVADATRCQRENCRGSCARFSSATARSPATSPHIARVCLTRRYCLQTQHAVARNASQRQSLILQFGHWPAASVERLLASHLAQRAYCHSRCAGGLGHLAVMCSRPGACCSAAPTAGGAVPPRHPGKVTRIIGAISPARPPA